MYSNEQIVEMFKDKCNTLDPKCKEYFDAYANIYKQSFINPCKSDKFNHHHFFPSFIYKQMIGEKNRYHTIEKLDENYNPKDNVCKLRVLYHILAHYYLALSMQGTVYEYDASNAFFTLINDYSRPLGSYTLDEVKELGRMIEENAIPNSIDHYITMSERKKLYKQSAEENKALWEDEHKEELKNKKEDMKKKVQEWKNEWKESHKEEIETRKKERKEYMKKMRKEWKENNYFKKGERK